MAGKYHILEKGQTEKEPSICKTHFKWIRILLGKKALEFINAVTTK